MEASVIIGVLLGAAIVGFLLFIRTSDIPQPAPISPFRHLDERKAAIYENLRDLQFEYRLDKLSDTDYQTTKLELQKELAKVLAETDRIKTEMGVGNPVPAAPKAAARPKCPHCGAEFEKSLKFCGECGKPMGAGS
jgi:hypothetical protein